MNEFYYEMRTFVICILIAILILVLNCARMTGEQKRVMIEAGLYIGMTIAEAIIERGQPVTRYRPRGNSGNEYLVYGECVLVFEDGKLERIDK